MGDAADSATSVTLLRLLGGPDRDEPAWRRFCDRYRPLIGRWCQRWSLQAGRRMLALCATSVSRLRSSPYVIKGFDQRP